MSAHSIRVSTPGQGGAVRSTPAANEPFAAFPHRITFDDKLEPLDKLLVLVLLYYAKDKTWCMPAVATLARHVGRCERTVQSSLARLRKAGYIGERPDANPTGRKIILLWREASCAPRCNPSTGQPPKPVQPASPECEKNKKQKEGPACAQGGAPGPEPMTAVQVAEVCEWLTLPVKDPKRMMADRIVASYLADFGSWPPLTPN